MIYHDLVSKNISKASLKTSALKNHPVTPPGSLDLLCFSHLRWDFVFQRPQHLMTRFARERRVFFWEEPIYEDANTLRLDVSRRADNLFVLVPHLSRGLSISQERTVLQQLLDAFLTAEHVRDYVAWYYTPMMLPFTRHLQARAVVYDCMDKLAAFKGAPASLLDFEDELMHKAHVVFTGGESLYEDSRHRHSNIHACPSSIDREHFAQARTITCDPADQVFIPHPRIGFAGVIDERMDIDLLREVAVLKPEWHFVMIGPVVKIDPAALPQLPNIHYLGAKTYAQLPSYMAGWDVAILPFARNDSTRFISPTKTPEYLAAGKPVVSTSIRDVVRPYGERDFVAIADTAPAFAKAIARLMKNSNKNLQRRNRVDEFLSGTSWDRTWQRMETLINEAVLVRLNRRQPQPSLRSPTNERRQAQATASALIASR